MKASIASLYQAVRLQQDIPPLLIGERANASGSKKFRDLLLADDYEGCVKIAVEQEAQGAHVIDLCLAFTGRDELADMSAMVQRCVSALKAPLMIDSTSPACIEAALRLYPGRAIVNSVNLEDGGVNLRRVCRAAKKYGAAVVALTIDQQGMAMTAADKLRVAKAIHAIAVGECGLRSQDILFDCLTFTVGSGDVQLRDAALHTLEAVRRIKTELPGCLTLLGVSNISFGLAPVARRILNSVFLHEAVTAGLDAAIVDAAKIVPLARIPEAERELCLDLLCNRQAAEEKEPLMRFIEHFSGQENKAAEQEDSKQQAEEQLFRKVLEGDKDELDDLLAILRVRLQPLAVINQILVPAMRHVGELFGKGELLLPFVLQSAEVMKTAVNLLEPYMDRAGQGTSTSILLATVQGDVHDIGKNLVDIILSNNGYTVYNIGIKVPVETIIDQAKQRKADLIGLSGLLVKSAIVMQESMAQFREAGLQVPILLGGAALSAKFVAETCVPEYGGPVIYCADAFAGLKAVQDFEAGVLTSTRYEPPQSRGSLPAETQMAEIDRSLAVPTPPFWGQRLVTDVDPTRLLPLINLPALFRARWGYRRGKMATAEYAELIEQRVQPLYADLVARALAEGWLQPKVSYGYFRCQAEGEKRDALLVEADGTLARFSFPRQERAPYLCIADYFKTAQEGGAMGDMVGFFVVTMGARLAEETARLYQANAYHDYLMLHGLSVELTEALAAYWHTVMRQEMGIADASEQEAQDQRVAAGREAQGCRYGFGYPACPDLSAHKSLFALLKPEQIGVSLTENMQMVPEQTTSAIVVHHRQARYFSI
jgi:5-methyltetrahydrofolate--homocysteine methyltransferase